MAKEDLYFDPLGRFVEIYPISTRALTVAFMDVTADNSQWPPIDQGFFAIKGVWFADDFEEVSYDGGFRVWGGGQHIFNVFRRREDISGLASIRQDANAFVQFDLKGIPPGPYKKVEYVQRLFATEFQGVEPDIRYVIEWWPGPKGSGPAGEPYRTEEDHLTSESSRNITVPRLTVQDFIDSNENGVPKKYLNTIFDEEFFGGEPPPDIWAIPLKNLDDFHSGGRAGFRVRLAGPEPAVNGDTQVFGDASYFQYDILTDQGFSLLVAGHLLPHIRLWFMDKVQFSADLELHVNAQVEAIIQADPLYHFARLWRNRFRR